MRWAMTTAALSLGCTYDLTALRRDAGADRPAVTTDASSTDRGSPDVAPGDASAARNGACDLSSAAAIAVIPPTAPGPSSATLAFGLATGDLQGAPALALPTGSINGCLTADPNRSPPTRVYRYQVVAGGRVTASTDTQFCTAFHSRVYALWSCGASDVAHPAACADGVDDGSASVLCPSSGDAGAGAGCTHALGTLDFAPTPPLAAGDVVYFAVTGPDLPSTGLGHRLWVGENAARLEAFAATSASGQANRCGCQTNTGTPRTVAFPFRVSGENFPVSASTTSSYLGVRDVPTGSFTGVALQLHVVRSVLGNGAGCTSGARAVFDLLVADTLLTSFSIGADLVAPVMVTVPYTAFAPIDLARLSTGMKFELQLRAVLPSDDCMTIDLDPSAGASTVTLYGG